MQVDIGKDHLDEIINWYSSGPSGEDVGILCSEKSSHLRPFARISMGWEAFHEFTDLETLKRNIVWTIERDGQRGWWKSRLAGLKRFESRPIRN
jgi:hypothetical protein